MSGPASNAQWYLARDGEQFGPISEQEMARFVELGHLKPNDLLWREGFPDWRPAMVVFPPHPRPLPGAPRRPARPDMVRPDSGRMDVGRGDVGRPRMVAEPFAGPSPHDRAGYVPEEEPRRRPSVLARIARLLAMVAVLAAAAAAGYVYRAQLTALLLSLSESSTSGPPVTDRSVELPPLAGFTVGNAEAVDASLQAKALWKVIKREFPEWYEARVAEAVQLAQDGKDDAFIAQLMGRKIAELRRQHAFSASAATAERLKTVALAYFDNLKRLRSHNAEVCAGFIRKGVGDPLVVPLLARSTDLTGPLQAQLIAVFEAIADGRQTPRVHIRPTADHQELLKTEFVKRGLTTDDLQLWFSGMADVPAEKACQIGHDFFAAHFAVPDPEAQQRLLILAVRRAFAAG